MELLSDILGLNTEKLNACQMGCRAFVVFFTSLAMIRIAGLRTLGKQSAFDVLTILTLGAVLGRSIVSGQSFGGTLLAALVLVLLHRVLAWAAVKSKWVGKIVKGETLVLFKNGLKNEKNMLWQHITEEDILEAIRHDANMSSLKGVEEAHLERSGEISIVKK